MTNEEKITRGKQILSEMQAVVGNYYAQYHKGIENKKPEHFDYYCNILHAVSPDTYDQPIPIKKMYLALAEAEEQGKKVQKALTLTLTQIEFHFADFDEFDYKRVFFCIIETCLFEISEKRVIFAAVKSNIKQQRI